MRFPGRELITSMLICSLGGCLLAGMRPREDDPAATLTSARMHASSAAPILPILVLRTAHEELSLGEADRASVAMVLHVAEQDARTLDRARAAFLEILARSVEAGVMDESQIALFTEQMDWAAGYVAPRMSRALDELDQLLTAEQRADLQRRVRTRLPVWAPAWATSADHPWPTSDLSVDLRRTSRSWAEKSAAQIRTNLPRLDASQKRALIASLRMGAIEAPAEDLQPQEP